MIPTWLTRLGIPSRRGCRPRLEIEGLEDRTVPGFLPGNPIIMGEAPLMPATAILTTSGHEDLVMTNFTGVCFQGPDTVVVRLGNGDGTFGPRVSYPTGRGPADLLIADVNGDGIPDIVTGNNCDGTVSVLLGLGDGTFQPHRDSPATHGLQSFSRGDFSGDGSVDLVTANSFGGDDSVSILHGNGDGTFALQTTFHDLMHPFAVQAGDFNGDGLDDFAVLDFHQFGSASSVRLYFNNGDGTFTPGPDIPVGRSGYRLTAGDFGNGYLGLIVSNYEDQSLSVLVGEGDGTFTSAPDILLPDSPGQTLLTDVNQDGIPDLVVSRDLPNQLSVFLGKGDGTFADPLNLAVGSRPVGIASADFNGDGYPDLVDADQLGDTVTVLINDGDWETFPARASAISLPMPVGPGAPLATVQALDKPAGEVGPARADEGDWVIRLGKASELGDARDRELIPGKVVLSPPLFINDLDALESQALDWR